MLTLVRLTFWQLEKCSSRNYKIGAIRVLFFSLKLLSGANQKKKEKFLGAGNILKTIEPGDAC